MPKAFKDSVRKRSQPSQKKQRIREDLSPAERGAKKKGSYTTAGGTPIRESDVT